MSAGSPPPSGQLTFTGEGREYFRIWLVNLALSVATLGVYSAWAKVRRLQFFYRHTRLDGAGFDFHGQPLAILKGRIVALILFALYSLAGILSGWFLLATIALLALVMPWLLARSFRFRLHNTSHRGIRFRFDGRTAESYWVFIGLPILCVLTLFTLVPYWHYRMRRYQHANAAYGSTRFSFHGEAWEFYVIYAVAFAMTVALILALGLQFLAIMSVTAQWRSNPGAPFRADLFVFLPMAVAYASVVLWLQAFVMARVQTHVWDRTNLGAHGFTSVFEAGPLFRILWVNLFATVVTLGLFRPFAQIRLARYYTSCLYFVAAGDVGTIAARQRGDDPTAAGEEAAEFFDFDIAF